MSDEVRSDDEVTAERRGERGASLVEYALLVALIAVVCIAGVTLVGRNGSNKLSTAGEAVGGSAVTTPFTCIEQQNPNVPGDWAHQSTQGGPILPGRCP